MVSIGVNYPHKNCRSRQPAFVACFPRYDDFKFYLVFQLLCSSKFHKYSNFGKAPYIVSSYPNQANVFLKLFSRSQDNLTPTTIFLNMNHTNFPEKFFPVMI